MPRSAPMQLTDRIPDVDESARSDPKPINEVTTWENRYRYALIPRGVRNRPGLYLLLRDDGNRIWFRELPHLSVSEPDEWELLLEYKHYNIPGFSHPFIDAMMTAYAIDIKQVTSIVQEHDDEVKERSEESGKNA